MGCFSEDYETDYEAREESSWYGSDDDAVDDLDVEVVEVDDSQELAEVVASGVNEIDAILANLEEKHPAFSR
jgi:hypothetical protein